jgi:hypothetical protein
MSAVSMLPLSNGEGWPALRSALDEGGEHHIRQPKANDEAKPPGRTGTNIIQLRQLLKEKFPGLRTHAEEIVSDTRNFWSTGLRQMDDLLGGGLSKGALTEIIAERRGTGSALLACSLLCQVAQAGQIVAFVDGSDSLEVTQLEEAALSRLLWIRCRSAAEALKATDLLLRDGNLPLVLLDIAINPEKQLRGIPATTWYRLQRILEQIATACVVFTPRAMVSPARDRIFLRSHFSLNSLEQEHDALLAELKMEAAETRRFSELEASAS